jgi:hypothetical protein
VCPGQVEEQASTIATLHDMKQQLIKQLHAQAIGGGGGECVPRVD